MIARSLEKLNLVILFGEIKRDVGDLNLHQTRCVATGVRWQPFHSNPTKRQDFPSSRPQKTQGRRRTPWFFFLGNNNNQDYDSCSNSSPLSMLAHKTTPKGLVLAHFAL